MIVGLIGVSILCFTLLWLLNKFDYLKRVGATGSYMLLQIVIIIILSIIFHR